MRTDGQISAILTDAAVKTAENRSSLCCRRLLAEGLNRPAALSTKHYNKQPSHDCVALHIVPQFRINHISMMLKCSMHP